ncbi:cysteine desulfurase [Bartonella sp. AR 15-3]|nr:cysteine desulfurase [Bartonella sp. AR 15-3]
MAVKRRYLDHNATAPLTKMARTALLEALEIFGNPSSVHTEGRAAKALLEKSRRQIADRLKANPDNVVFTSGASEAAMTLLTPFYHMGRSEVQFSHLYIGASEHPSIAEGGRFSKELISIIDVNQHGLIQQDKLKSLLMAHDNAKGLPLIAIQAANGETGVIQNIQEIATIVREARGTLIVDLVQYVDKHLIDINHFGVISLYYRPIKLEGLKELVHLFHVAIFLLLILLLLLVDKKKDYVEEQKLYHLLLLLELQWLIVLLKKK